MDKQSCLATSQSILLLDGRIFCHKVNNFLLSWNFGALKNLKKCKNYLKL